MSAVKAAVLRSYGTPEFGEFDEPDAAPRDGYGEVVEVLAATVNSVDRALASGAHRLSPTLLPAVCGVEGVGRRTDGRRVHFSWPAAPYGSLAERTLVDPDRLIEVPDGLDDAVAAALGNAGWAAWLPLSWRAGLRPGERVLILGATGVVGRLATQSAKLLGAGQVVAAGRDTRALAEAVALGADAAVHIDDLSEAGPADVIIDYTWGAPARAALQAAAPGVRLVQIGDRADRRIALSGALLRGKGATIMGFQQNHADRQTVVDAYRQMAEHAMAGRLRLDVERRALSEVAQLWGRGARRELVLIP